MDFIIHRILILLLRGWFNRSKEASSRLRWAIHIFDLFNGRFLKRLFRFCFVSAQLTDLQYQLFLSCICSHHLPSNDPEEKKIQIKMAKKRSKWVDISLKWKEGVMFLRINLNKDRLFLFFFCFCCRAWLNLWIEGI